MKKISGFFLLMGLFTSFCDKLLSQDLKLLEKTDFIYYYELSKTGYSSDGSDRARNGTPRFAGPMEATGITYNGFQYVCYYESNGDIVIARRNVHKPDTWIKSVLQNYRVKSNDRHNRITLGISEGDGVIHIAFDHHNTPQINYACTEVGVAIKPESIAWDNNTFKYNPNMGIEEETGLITYPSFISLKGTGNMILYWRTGGAVGGEMNLAHYNSKDQSWNLVGQISSRFGYYNDKYGTRGPYHTGFNTNVEGDIHVAWLWRENFELRDQADIKYGNHGLFYAQSKDGGYSWLNNEGKLIADTRKGEQISIDNIEPAIDIPMILEPSNALTSSAIDPKTGFLHVFSVHYKKNSKDLKTHHYIRNAKGKWITKVLELTSDGNSILFVDDFLFCLAGTKIFVSKREDSFHSWSEIPTDKMIPAGPSKWDTSRISESVLSLIVQHDPGALGKPSPIEVYDFRFAETD